MGGRQGSAVAVGRHGPRIRCSLANSFGGVPEPCFIQSRDSDAACPDPQASDGPVLFRPYQGMDKWDYNMQNRDAKLIRESLGAKAAKAAWWDSAKKAI